MITCSKCNYVFIDGEVATGLTNVVMTRENKNLEPIADDQEWLAIYCGDCSGLLHHDINVCQQNVRDASRE